MSVGHALDNILNHVCAGARIGLYSTFTALTRVAICFGPLGAALMFWWSGNVWETHVIEQIMLVGVGLSAVSILPMFLFNDDLTLGADSDAYQELLTIEGGLSSCSATPEPRTSQPLARVYCCRSLRQLKPEGQLCIHR